MSKCFVIMPFRKQYDKFFKLIEKISAEFTIEIIRADKAFLSVPVMENINVAIAQSDYIIALIGDDHNANVFYELGISHTQKPFSKVLIFKDKKEEYQFDIQHIKQFSVDFNSLKNEGEIIRRFFELNENASSLENALSSINYFKTNPTICDTVIDFLKSNYQIVCDDIAKLILSQKTASSLPVIIPSLIHATLSKALENNENLAYGLFTLYGEIVSKTIGFYDHKRDIFDILNNSAIESKYTYILATNLIEKGIMLNDCISWLISYFGKNDVHRIDISRHRIEEFLVLSNLDETNNALISALSHEIPHVREYCAEVIREKKLKSARSALLEQLNNESNLYAARSIIDAICALDISTKEIKQEIYKAILNFKSKIIYTEKDFIAKHVNLAIEKFQ